MTTPETPAKHAAPSRPRRVKPAVIGVGGLIVAAGVTLTLLIPALTGTTPAGAAAASVQAPHTSTYTAPSKATIAGLPEAKYDAVITGLVAYDTPTAPGAVTADTITADTPLYGSDGGKPVAKLAAHNFLGQPTIVVPVKTAGDWTLVLTPARQALPSKQGGHAAAQSAGWLRTSALTIGAPLTSRIVVSVSQQTLTITTGNSTPAVFKVGVGTQGTPTPTGVTGYLQARYADASQGTGSHPIQLTSLHSATADAPYQGAPGGLIGAHYNANHTGTVSHGCIRLDAAALTAVNTLPLGTPITIAE